MKKTLKITLLIIVYLLAFSTTVQAYSVNFKETPSSVKSGETFTFKITVDEPTAIANSHIKYDSSLFEFVGTKQTNLSADIYQSAGEIAWMYTDFSTSSKGVKSFEIKFKAKDVTANKIGNFKMTEPVFITTKEKTYETNDIKGDKSFAVTVKPSSSKSTKTTSKITTTKKSNITTSGTKTNQVSTTIYNISTKNDTTMSNKTSLPKTGENDNSNNMLLAFGVLLLISAIVFKIKSERLY